MRRLMCLACLLVPTIASAQVRARPMLVSLEVEPAAIIRREYDPSREALYCVTSYTIEDKGDYDVARAREIRRVDIASTKREIADVPPTVCTDGTGRPQPMLHSHPNDHNGCQPSPGDIDTMLARRPAPFNGIICSPEIVAWQITSVYSAAQYVAAQDYFATRQPE